MGEIWKEIKGYEYYLISTEGNVKVKHSNKMITTHNLQGGYKIVCLRKEKKWKQFKMHRLIADAFIENGDVKNKKIVNHKDGNKLNNNTNNLEWVTHSENSKHAHAIGMYNKHLKTPKKKLDDNYDLTKFKNINDYPNYRISKLGEIYSDFNNILLKTCISNIGYVCVSLRKDKSKKTHQVHQLVAKEYLVYPNDGNKYIINHIDGDKTNCNAENLEWVTQSDNIKHAYNTKLKLPNKKKVCQIDLTDNTIKIFDSLTEAENITGVKMQSIIRVCKGKRKTSHGYKWQYV